ncbi:MULTISPECIES: SDR family oxidoreductase [Oceanobacillus]|uniref:2-deoxy-D-gluconate 3-dehydrogenase n=1 Tax=Oceanobacillus sojae TaxID=582851 RepID=A0A511ZEB9_9BACI|nr:SDR family oxidoreductase [Oceanobacillus sojae]GEN85795.1 2-deoxy-D-gluconate 3-dehydrogenase [Oceanobacillus sojae]
MAIQINLENKVAVVTGATRGIGKAIAIGLAEAGADIALIQRSTDITVQEEIKGLGRNCEIIECDLSDLKRVREVIPEVKKKMESVDILINCAGIQRRYPAVDFPEHEWDAVIDVNLKSVWILCQEAGKIMTTQQRGKIINVASLVSFQGGILVPAYTAAKGAVGQLTKELANEWSSLGVNVNALVPGYFATEMNTALINDPERSKQILDRIPAGRWGDPNDMKGAAVFLASSLADYIHGHLLAVDGGWLAR